LLYLNILNIFCDILKESKKYNTMVTFINTGNTCYFNVLMQILIFSRKYPQSGTQKNKLQTSWYYIINKLQKLKINTIYNPVLLFRLLKWDKFFIKGKKHDAHEAFLHLVDYINYYDFKGKEIEFMNTTDAPYEKNLREININSLEISVNHDNLNDCLQEYFKIESIPGWKDSKNRKRVLQKSTRIYKAPLNLVILLRQTYFSKKRLLYPLKLDINEWYVGKTPIYYTIRSVVIHKYEHFYVYCKNGSQWYLFNDEQSIELNNNDWMQEEAPYMLVYELIQT
tara:strand:- start:888 stop:1733 length:846 start_codon:yes stop_codon:yes gene_type:complete